ncbi:glycosyltransferase family 4 protein [Corynebacterium sp. YIM 101645]|uniref:Glycosyltransferase family 4 protein n=1 Tax=Corynebacterium lemuris TaxID=1859292 RepID=A0ABT2FZX6_9CORY|nr:glycosyltransferase family 4 protein [Corynebacterium lemuris]MCS5480812.1 glycosyltransferase family 4 protein [Corynebacterium lemuris]
MRKALSGRDRKLVIGVTVGASAFSLLRGQLEWFRESGWDVTLVSTPDEVAKKAAEREGVPLVGIRMNRRISPVKDVVALRNWIRLLRTSRPTAVNVGTPKAALLGMLAAWSVRVPHRLYVVRGLRLEGTSGPLSWLLWCMEKLTMQLATDVLYVSRSLAQEASRRHLFSENKAWLVGSGSSNGVNAQAILSRVESVDRTVLRNELGLESGDFVAGFVGRVTRDKGVDTLLNALRDPRIDNNVRGLLIGSIEDPSLAEEIKSLGSRITYLPWTDDVWGHLPAMDVLCLPTLREGFPNVVLEAAAAGVPTIATRATGAIDSVVPGVTGMLIEVGDHHALVDRLNELCSDRSLGCRLGRAASQRVFEEYTQERIWEGLAEILTANPSPQHAIRAVEELKAAKVVI